MPLQKPSIDGQMADQRKWGPQAACRGVTGLFDTYTASGVTIIDSDVEMARDICSACPVMLDCLRHAVRFGIDDGVWGGLVAEERNAWAAEHQVAV